MAHPFFDDQALIIKTTLKGTYAFWIVPFSKV